MTYEECYKNIIDNFKLKIQTNDKVLKIKIFNNLVKWYKSNLEEELKIHFQNDNKLGITNVLKRIEFVCKHSDLEKLEIVYSNSNYENFIKFSDYIFSLVLNFIKSNQCSLKENDFIEYIAKIEQYESKIPKILLNKYNYYKSECILDLEYLKSNGKVSNYSFRTYNLLNNQQ